MADITMTKVEAVSQSYIKLGYNESSGGMDTSP